MRSSYLGAATHRINGAVAERRYRRDNSSASTPPHGTAMTEAAEYEARHLNLLRAVVQALNRPDLDGLMELFTNDCVFEAPRGQRPQGRRFDGQADVRRAFARMLRRFPDARYSDVEHWVCGDRGVSEWNLVRTQGGRFAVVVRGCDLWRFRDGKIALRNSFWKIVASPEGSAEPKRPAQGIPRLPPLE
jgi:ketosteroid isomerase-like protein